MDPITQMIELLRPRALHWKQVRASGDWAIRFPDEGGIVFGLLDSGTCRLEAPGLGFRPLQSGDFLLLAAPRSWVLRSGNEARAVELEALDPDRSKRSICVGDETVEPTARLLCGRFTFDTVNAELLIALMPPLIHLRSYDSAAARLRGILDLIGDEAWSDRPEQALVIGRLLELMLIESLRGAQVPAGDDPRRGLIAGLSDRHVAAALRALHQDLRRAWKVADLAVLAGMSRSVFAERFTRLVGTGPINYHLKWRMAVAKDQLRLGRRPLAEVAKESGYQSTSAFSTAFSRIVGCPPARFAGGPAAEIGAAEGMARRQKTRAA